MHFRARHFCSCSWRFPRITPILLFDRLQGIHDVRSIDGLRFQETKVCTVATISTSLSLETWGTISSSELCCFSFSLSVHHSSLVYPPAIIGVSCSSVTLRTMPRNLHIKNQTKRLKAAGGEVRYNAATLALRKMWFQRKKLHKRKLNRADWRQ